MWWELSWFSTSQLSHLACLISLYLCSRYHLSPSQKMRRLMQGSVAHPGQGRWCAVRAGSRWRLCPTPVCSFLSSLLVLHLAMVPCLFRAWPTAFSAGHHSVSLSCSCILANALAFTTVYISLHISICCNCVAQAEPIAWWENSPQLPQMPLLVFITHCTFVLHFLACCYVLLFL